LLAALAEYPLSHPSLPANQWLVIFGGFLVGLGSRMGGGCTSGHGVCGLARLSARSLVFTAVFMAAAIATVGLVRHAVRG